MSLVDDYFSNFSDFLAKLEDLTTLPGGLADEITLSCNTSFASREKAILSRSEMGVGLVAAAVAWPGCPNRSPKPATSRAMQKMDDSPWVFPVVAA